MPLSGIDVEYVKQHVEDLFSAVDSLASREMNAWAFLDGKVFVTGRLEHGNELMYTGHKKQSGKTLCLLLHVSTISSSWTFCH